MTHTADTAPPPAGRAHWWRYARPLLAPLLLWVLVVVTLVAPLQTWLRGEESYDRAVLQEWLEEARGFRETLPEMIETYVRLARTAGEFQRLPPPPRAEFEDPRRMEAVQSLVLKRTEIYDYLEALGTPPTKMYSGQLPLFPIIYHMEVRFHLDGTPAPPRPAPADNAANGPAAPPEPVPADAPIIWDSQLPTGPNQYQVFEHQIHPNATVSVHYQLHAYNKRQRIEQEHNRRLRQLSVLAAATTILGLTWLVLVQRRERDRERQRLIAQQQVDQAERLLLREERRHAETERKLLEQRLATQAAERRALELKSQLYASIGIMAGSYAHNIKNLLVRPNDLLRRCLEADGLSSDQETMLHEVQQTLGTVTERLQQILQTVRRDPSRSEEKALDLNAVLRDLAHTWADLARDKWKLDLALELAPGLVGIKGDVSHLQQAVENLLFNARDATFEMRSRLRDRAHGAEGLDAPARRQALIAAAGWRGRVVLRTRREGGQVVLEVSDNGAGMTEEVRRRCTETHFSTKRDNALYEGHSTGMGLGLSFVVAILEHHHAALEIESEPLHGAVFRIRFPAAEET